MPMCIASTVMERCELTETYGSTIHYEPNSYGEWQEQPQYKEPALDIHGAADRWNFREDDDNYFEQPGKLFNLMNDEQKEALFLNTAA